MSKSVKPLALLVAAFFLFFGIAAVAAGVDEGNPANIFGGLIFLVLCAWAIGLLWETARERKRPW